MNNPLKYTDPTGHCASDPYDAYYDYECWELVLPVGRAAASAGAGGDDYIMAYYGQMSYEQLSRLNDVLLSPLVGHQDTIAAAANVFGLPPELVAATVAYENYARGLEDGLQDAGLWFGQPTLGIAQMNLPTAQDVVAFIEGGGFNSVQLANLGYTAPGNDEELEAMLLNPQTAIVLAAGRLAEMRQHRIDNPYGISGWEGALTTDHQLVLYSHYTAGPTFYGWKTATEPGGITRHRVSGWLDLYREVY